MKLNLVPAGTGIVWLKLGIRTFFKQPLAMSGLFFMFMLVLGACYALGFLTIMGISALIDGGQFAKLYLVGGPINEALVMQANFQRAMWVTMALYLPFSLLFWHAPALVHWYGISPLKSLFFSAMACYKNFGALCVFGLAWFGITFRDSFIATSEDEDVLDLTSP